MIRPTFALILASSLFSLPGYAQDGITSAPIIGASLTEKIWMRSDRDNLPGSMMLFLSEGTLLQDSCWETYRLSNWQMTSEEELSWDEDGMEINATIVELNEAELVLELHLVSETVTYAFEAAPVPYLCPDMPR